MLEFTVVGGMTLRRGDLVVDDDAFGGRQQRLVAGILLLDRRDPVPVDRLVNAVWPGGPPEQYRPALRGLVSKVRGLLAQVGVEGDPISGRSGVYVVDLPGLEVDLECAEAALSRAQSALAAGDLSRAQEHGGAARAVLSRPIMSGLDAPWLEGLRERVARQHLETLLVLGECRGRQGRTGPARTIVREALDLDPLREDVWRLAMRIEVGGGNVARALALYEQLRELLADELGADPSRETQTLHASVLVSTPDPAASVPSLSTAEEREQLHRQGEVEMRPGRHGGTSSGADVLDPPNPYVGLRSFSVGESERFFGREAAIQEVVKRLDRYGALAVVGSSGVGKSSLVRAGLLPALARGAIPESDTWRVVVMTPGHQPINSLAGSLLASRPGTDGLDESTLVALLTRDPLALHEFLFEPDGEGRPTRTLLVVDQAEELFTLGDHGEVEALLEAVFAAMSAARTPGPRLAAVFTLRADFYAQASQFAHMAGLLSRAQFVVSPLSGDGLQMAITEPARRSGAELEDGLLGRLVAGAGIKANGLALVQHVLWELWERRDHERLTLEALDELGGVSGALARHAEEVWQTLDEDEAVIARRLLLRAVSASERRATAVPVRKQELAGLAPAEEVDSVVSTLVTARLMTASGARTAGRDDDSAAVELAHETLLGEWPRLRRWIDDERETLMLAQRVRDLAADWERQDRDPSQLLRGSRLAQVQRHGRLLELTLTDSELAFVAASVSAREEALEQERRRQTVKESRKLAVEALITKTEDPERAALLALESVRNSRESGMRAEPEAVGALHEALQASRLVRRFDGGARLVVTDPDSHWIIVQESTESTNPMLVDLTTGSRRTFVGPTPPGDTVPEFGIWELALSPSGRQLAASYDFSGSFFGAHRGLAQQSDTWPKVAVFDVTDGTISHTLDAPSGTYWSLDYHPQGTLLAGANSIDTVAVWDTDSYDLVATHEFRTEISEVAFAPADETLLVMSVDPPRLVRIDPLTGDEHGVVDLPRWGDCLMAVQPQGELVALAHITVGRVVIRNLTTGTVLHDWQATLPWCAAWSPDGTQVAYSGVAGTIVVRKVATGNRVCELAGNTSVRSLDILADGRHLVNPTTIGITNVWDISPAGRPVLGGVAVAAGTIYNFWPDSNERLLAVTTRDPPAFQLIDARDGHLVTSLPLHGATPELAVDIDRLDARANAVPTAVAVLEGDGRSTLRRLPDLDVVCEFDNQSAPLAVSPDATFVALNKRRPSQPSDMRGWHCQVFDTKAASPILDLDYGAHSASFIPSTDSQVGPLIAINAKMAELFVFDLDSRQEVGRLHPSMLGLTNHFGVAFSPNGKLLAGGSQEGLVWVVDVADLLAGTAMKDAVTFTMSSHTGPATKPAITDSGLLATAGYDSHIRLWNIHSESLLADFTIEIAPSQLPCLRFTHDQQALLYTEAGNLIRRFPVDVDELLGLADKAITRTLTQAERRRHGLADPA